MTTLRYTLAIIQVILLVALGAGGLRLVRGHSVPRPPPMTPVRAPPSAPSESIQQPLAWYAPLWERALQQPLEDPPLPPVVTAPPAPLPALLATCVVDHRRLAHVRNARGAVQLVQQGDTVDAFTVLAIEPGRMHVQFQDGTHWITVPRPPGPLERS